MVRWVKKQKTMVGFNKNLEIINKTLLFKLYSAILDVFWEY